MPDPMKLQLNARGAWRDVITFSASDRGRVEISSSHLASMAEPAVKLRIVRDRDDVVAWWDLDKGWHKPPFAG